MWTLESELESQRCYLTSCVNLDRLLNHSVFQCLYLYTDDDIRAYLLGFLES